MQAPASLPISAGPLETLPTEVPSPRGSELYFAEYPSKLQWNLHPAKKRNCLKFDPRPSLIGQVRLIKSSLVPCLPMTPTEPIKYQ